RWRHLRHTPCHRVGERRQRPVRLQPRRGALRSGYPGAEQRPPQQTGKPNLRVARAHPASPGILRRRGTGTRRPPGQTAFGRPDLDAFVERNDGVASVQFDQRANPWFRQRASYSLATSYQQSTDLTTDPPFTAMYQGRVALFQSTDFLNDTANRLHRHHADYQADVRLASGSTSGDQLLTILADWDGERVTAIDRQTHVETPNSRDNFGVAAQEQMLWRRWFVTAGGRIEKNESFGTAFVPRGTVVFVAHQPSAAFGETLIKASAGTGVKEPTL